MVEREYEGKTPETTAKAAGPSAPMHLMVQVRSAPVFSQARCCSTDS